MSFLIKLKNLADNPSLKQYTSNTTWLIGERFISIVISFSITVLIARYLGPEDYGLWAYVLSLVAILNIAGHMGLSGLIVREIVKKPEERSITLGTTLILKACAVLIAYLGLIIYAGLYEGIGSIAFKLIAIAGLVILLKPMEVIESWFDSFVQAKYGSIARLASLIGSSIVKFAIIFFGAGILFFAWATLFQTVMWSLILLLLYIAKSKLKISTWRFNATRAKELLNQGWMVYLGSIFAVIYMKVDLVMLRWLSSPEAVGQYAIAAQLSEAWYFVPAAIVTTIFPKLIKLREQNKEAFNYRLQQLFDMLFMLAFFVAVFMTLISNWLVSTFFGNEYLEAAPILMIHVWAALFVFMRAAFSKWILIENFLIFSLITQGLGALINVLLNFLLIPEYGGVGAAYATLISYATASYFSLLIYGKSRKIFWMMTIAIVSPVRYMRKKIGFSE